MKIPILLDSMPKLFKKGIVAICLGLYAIYPTLVVYAALTTSIVSYWKLDESSGNPADSVGSNTLTNENTTAFAAALINNGGDFGSTNTTKAFSRTDALGLTYTSNFTYSAWFKLQTAPSNAFQNILYIKDSTALGWYSRVFYGDTAGVKTIYAQRLTNTSVTSATTITTDVWHHFVYTFDGTTMLLYYDGSLLINGGTQSGSTDSSANGAAVFAIGRERIAGDGGFWKGMVDEVGVWSRALSSTEVTSLYNAGVGLQYPFTVASTVPFYWNWDF